MRALALGALALASGCGATSEAAPDRARPQLVPVTDELCATRGQAPLGGEITAPTMRAIARGTRGDAAALDLVYRGATEEVRELATSGVRRQLGLKLRAHDGCNLVYVMWRLDPRPKLEVSVKRNAGAADHEACGADGYTKVKPTKSWPTPALVAGDKHTLRAAITGDELTAWIDDRVVWRGTLPASARDLAGPAGVRSDNLAFDLVAFSAPRLPTGTPLPACPKHDPE